MTLAVLALALVAAPVEQTNDAAQKPTLYIDSCVDVDVTSVHSLVELELRDRQTAGIDAPITVEVRCLEGGQQIRVEPWASLGADGIRAIVLPPVDDAYPAAREARSRELALAVAELIRRLEITRPLPPPAPPPPPPVVLPPPAPEPRRHWHVGALSSFEAFSGGQRLVGADLAVAARLGRWVLTEVRVGGRFIDAGRSAVAHLTGRGATATLAVGPALWSQHGAVGVALLLRTQGYAIDYQADPVGVTVEGTPARLAALTIGAEPRLFVALSPWIALTAGLGVATPLHGIVVRTQGAQTDSLTGVAFSGGLGVAVTF